MKLEYCYLFKVVVVVVCVLVYSSSSSRVRVLGSKEAYATLLYGDDYLLGARVLGKSIRNTGSNKDMVALVSAGVSKYATKLLKADGWIVEKVSLLANPNQVRAQRYWGVYTKLKIFNMTNYKRVVYLDADTVVVKNIEDMFKCGKFCANLKHSERMNAGVLVVEPSQSVFNDMMSKVNTLPSYTGGDQGFLQSYYSDFATAPLFDPAAPERQPLPRMQRFTTFYNADVGLMLISNKILYFLDRPLISDEKWMADKKDVSVLHYTLGPLKPWDWWTSWLVLPVDIWQNIREQLGESLPGTAGGKNPEDELKVKFLFLLPLCALIACYYGARLQPGESMVSLQRTLANQIRYLYYKTRSNRAAVPHNSVSSPSSKGSNHQAKLPSYLGGASVFVCILASFISVRTAFAVVPRTLTPWTGLLLTYEWVFTIFFLVFGSYIRLVYLFGQRSAFEADSFSSNMESVDHDSGKGHLRQTSSCDMVTWYYIFGILFLAALTPLLPFIFEVNALFARIRLMAYGGLVLACFMIYASEHLAIRAFLRGYQDRDSANLKSFCLTC